MKKKKKIVMDCFSALYRAMVLRRGMSLTSKARRLIPLPQNHP